MEGFRYIVAALAPPLLCAAPLCAQTADEPIVLAPSSEWTIERRGDSCGVRRQFQSGGREATLELRQFSPGDDFRATLWSTTLIRGRGTPGTRFEPDEGFYQPTAVDLRVGENRGVFLSDSLRPNNEKRPGQEASDWPESVRDAREQAIVALTVSSVFARTVTLQVGSLHEPMSAMRMCLDEFLIEWGLDPATQRTLSRHLEPIDLMDWKAQLLLSYPTRLLELRRGGLFYVRLIVGPDGKPMACIPDDAFSRTGADEYVCNLMRREARFVPALDANGAAVASLYTVALAYGT